MTSLTYHDATGVVHEVAARKTAACDWAIVDTCAGEELVIESLDGHLDGEAQADAVASDYVTAGRFMSAAGLNGGEAIPEQGGADAHRDRRPRSEARQ